MSMTTTGATNICQIETNSEDTLSLHCLFDGRLVTGHSSSTYRVWSQKRESVSLLHSVCVPVAGDILSICQSPSHHQVLAVCVASSILCYDLRNLSSPTQIFSHNTEEINQIRFHPTLPYICACDDSGEIKVVSYEECKLLQTLTGCHSNLCICASFLPQTPLDIVSGSMDCKLVRWKWSKATPLVEVIVRGENMFVNPPMVYSLDTWEDNQHIACGLGNGVVSVYEVKNEGMKLKCVSTLHFSMVVSLCCVKREETMKKIYYVISGGNDGNIILSVVAESFKALKSVQVIQHSSKINWITVSTENVFVADQTPIVTIYKIVFA